MLLELRTWAQLHISTSTFARCLYCVFDTIDRGREACDPQEDEQLHCEGGRDERERGGRVGSERSPDASEADDEHLLDATCPQSVGFMT